MDARVQILIALMKENLHREMPVDELACAVGLSPSHLHQLFKADTCMSLACCLSSLKIEHAKELLKSSPLSIKQVMMRVGMIDRSHFDRKFKKAYGVTPAQYKIEFQQVGVPEKAVKDGQQKRP